MCSLSQRTIDDQPAGHSQGDRQKNCSFHIINVSISGCQCPKFIPKEYSNIPARFATFWCPGTPLYIDLDGFIELTRPLASTAPSGFPQPAECFKLSL